jgi:hypothetical protein
MYTDFAEMKPDEYPYWQSRSAHQRLDGVEEVIQTAYSLKGWEIEPDVPRFDVVWKFSPEVAGDT